MLHPISAETDVNVKTGVKTCVYRGLKASVGTNTTTETNRSLQTNI